ncbi:MAG: hypothetical protein ACRD3V_21220 [Vicinamibacteria bacterium]
MPHSIWLSLCLSLEPVQEDPARFFDYDEKAPLDFRVGSEETVEGVSVQDVSYASAKKGRVPDYLVRPPGRGPFAGIIYMHWGQGDRTEFLSEAFRHGSGRKKAPPFARLVLKPRLPPP